MQVLFLQKVGMMPKYCANGCMCRRIDSICCAGHFFVVFKKHMPCIFEMINCLLIRTCDIKMCYIICKVTSMYMYQYLKWYPLSCINDYFVDLPQGYLLASIHEVQSFCLSSKLNECIWILCFCKWQYAITNCTQWSLCGNVWCCCVISVYLVFRIQSNY